MRTIDACNTPLFVSQPEGSDNPLRAMRVSRQGQVLDPEARTLRLCSQAPSDLTPRAAAAGDRMLLVAKGCNYETLALAAQVIDGKGRPLSKPVALVHADDRSKVYTPDVASDGTDYLVGAAERAPGPMHACSGNRPSPTPMRARASPTRARASPTRATRRAIPATVTAAAAAALPALPWRTRAGSCSWRSPGCWPCSGARVTTSASDRDLHAARLQTPSEGF